ncbi:hypothetical protein BVC80_1837g267 [Macleaya cordata]|uniref:Uncharacterized protein n=1 Tax=Macleaya cordata TaxID=56857 RepID=A0A200R3Z2_MACCD|nr:hypothetical protein BVC80_1837g267 [Macleaya cordata]
MGECSTSDIGIIQKKVNQVQGVDEYEVEIQNYCQSCGLSGLVIGCEGFQTVEPVEPALFKQLDGGDCLINGGDFITRGIPIRFRYAWQTPTNFYPKKVVSKCSSR